MKLVCTVTLVNRLAEANGISGEMSRPAKSVIQLRTLEDGKKQILVSTKTDVSGQRFYVNKIRKIRDSFLRLGLVTIEIKDPQVNIMIKNNDNPAAVQQFIAELRGEPRGDADADKPSTSGMGTSDSMAKKSDVLQGPKRARSPEISKVEGTSIRNHLKKDETTLYISKRKNYPLNVRFSSQLINLSIQKINMKRIDPKIFALKNLAVLDLSNNGISSIDKLKFLESSLQSLIVSYNQIEKLDEDLFLCKPFENLKYLNLRGNKLQILPTSIVYLSKLQILVIAENQLAYIPHNIHFMRSLQTLKAQNNKLTFASKQILEMGLIDADLSSNRMRSKRSNSSLDHVGTKYGCPTLFEIAQEAVLNQSLKSPDPNRLFYKLGRSEVPQIIREHFNRAKTCDICSRLTVRYTLHEHSDSLHRVAQKVVGYRYIPVKAAICVKCNIRLKFQAHSAHEELLNNL